MAELLQFVLAVKQPPLEVVLLASDDAHLVLHVAIFEHLLLKLLLGGHQLLGLTVKLLLHLI